MNDGTEVKPRSLRFTWSMKTTSSRDPNEIMAEIKKVIFANKKVSKKFFQNTYFIEFFEVIYESRFFTENFGVFGSGKFH